MFQILMRRKPSQDSERINQQNVRLFHFPAFPKTRDTILFDAIHNIQPGVGLHMTVGKKDIFATK